MSKIKDIIEKTTQWLKKVYRKLNDLSGGVLEILRHTFTNFGKERGSEAAASLAYYAVFSIFPLILVFIVVGSFFVDRTVVQNQLLSILQGIIPGAREVVISNIEQVLKLRGAVTFIALISLFWSASNVFNVLAKNVNRAFPKAEIPNFFEGRLLGFGMILGMALLLLLSLAVSTFSSLIPVINIPLNGKPLHETFIWQIGAFLVPVGINTLMFWAIYRWVPTIKVTRKASILGGLVAGVTWELLNNVFAWYLSSGLSSYQLVYGSIGSVVALLFWIYLTAMITLICAHLTAAIHNSQMNKDPVPAS